MILAIDPGPTESAFVLYDAEHVRLERFGKLSNMDMLLKVYEFNAFNHRRDMDFVIEMIASFGMPVGAEIFNTCVWIGRFIQTWAANALDRDNQHTTITRGAVKLQICGSVRAKDGNVRQALIDRFGGSSVIKKGGSLYKVSGDVWAALAVAVTYAERTKAMQVAA